MLKELDAGNAKDEHLSKAEMENLFNQQIRKIMSKQVRGIDKEVKSMYTGFTIMGNTTKFVDIVMYLSILFLVGFGYQAYKKLKEQSDMLVL